MKEKNNAGKATQNRIVRLRLVDGTLVNGQVNINRSYGYDRLSDLISDTTEPFLIIHHATVHQGTLENPVKHKTIFLNKHYVVWVEPDEDQN